MPEPIASQYIVLENEWITVEKATFILSLTEPVDEHKGSHH